MAPKVAKVAPYMNAASRRMVLGFVQNVMSFLVTFLNAVLGFIQNGLKIKRNFLLKYRTNGVNHKRCIQFLWFIELDPDGFNSLPKNLWLYISQPVFRTFHYMLDVLGIEAHNPCHGCVNRDRTVSQYE